MKVQFILSLDFNALVEKGTLYTGGLKQNSIVGYTYESIIFKQNRSCPGLEVGGEGMGSQCLVGTGFQFCTVERVLEARGCTTV